MPEGQNARRGRLSSDLTWLLLWTATGLAIRAIHTLWLHPIGAYLWSDMAGHFYTAQRFASPRHAWARMDVIKPRAMEFVGAAILHAFGQGDLGKQLWGLLQVLLSAATLPLAFVGARRFFGRRAARIAIAILALDALAISFAGFLMVETYAMFCLALAFALLSPARPWLSLCAGAALGLAGLFKPQILLLAPAWCLLLLLWPTGSGEGAGATTGTGTGSGEGAGATTGTGTGSGEGAGATTGTGSGEGAGATGIVGGFVDWIARPRRISAVLLGVGILALVVPETIAVSRIVGRPTLLSAYSGQNFYVGHCDVRLMTMKGKDPSDWFTAGVPKVYERNEPWPDVTFNVSVFDSDFYFREGMKCWRKSFWGSVLWSVEQLADVFAGWPGSTIDPFPIPGGWDSLPRWFSVILEYLLVPLAFADLWRRRRLLGGWVGFGAPMGAIWALALVFSGDPRYREPFDVFIVSAAAGQLGTLSRRFVSSPVLGWLEKRVGRLSACGRPEVGGR